MHTDRQMSNIISIVNYSHFVSNVQPSSTTTKRSNSAAGNNGLEDKTAQSGDNKGVSFIVIIGAAGSGAVVVVFVSSRSLYIASGESQGMYAKQVFQSNPLVEK